MPNDTRFQERILIVEDEENARKGYEALLRKWGFEILGVGSGEEALAKFPEFSPSVILADVELPGMNGLDLLRHLGDEIQRIPVIIITGRGSDERVVHSIEAGAYWYIEKPLKPPVLRALLDRALGHSRDQQELAALTKQLRDAGRLGTLVGSSSAMQEVMHQVEMASPSTASVLITGETGSGKEMVARSIHMLSPRASRPFVAINCSAIPESLMESEIFGHEKGAFTGAAERRLGCFELADGGTLLLDEIGEMPAPTQAKLLRVLEDHKVRRLGSKVETSVDVRVVAATNKNPEQAVASGHLRQDLYFRLNVFHIHLPPLREHKDDLPMLTDHLLAEISEKHGKKVSGVGSDVMELFKSYPWPGNVRELRNVLERAAIATDRSAVMRQHLPPDFGHAPAVTGTGLGAIRFPVGTTVDDAERELIFQTLTATNQNKTRAAELLGVSLKTLHNKLKEYEAGRKMRLSLKSKFTLAASLLVLGVVAVVSGLYLGRLTQQVLRQADDRARFVAQQVFLACRNAFADAAEHGQSPASADPQALREYVQTTLDGSSTLNSLIESAVGYSPTIYEITISDSDDVVMVSSDASLRGQKAVARPSVTSLVRDSFFRQLRALYGPPQTYEFSLPFNLGSGPFGQIRIELSSTLLRDEISPQLISSGYWAIGSVLLSTLLAFFVSRISLAPIERISAQLDRISAGQFDTEPAVQEGDELGAVSTKITGIGKQLRDVREIFSTLRENLDQVMSGIEDGLILFNAEGRTVLVSPSVEKFLGGNASELSGKRVSEIFPDDHPLRKVLQIDGDEIEQVEWAELVLNGKAGPRRVGVGVQGIRENGERVGTLVTLRDVESIERIGDQLQVSERLAALGRVTAGVAHEVKNPLNSMRLWLEVLKANMPIEPEPQQAVKMLDSEIDRLDRAVKTFLNFTRPLELKLEEADLRILLDEVLDAARPSITKAGLLLIADWPDEYPAVFVDRQIIHQALLNLLLNACEFTDPGGQITVILERNAEFAVVSVADSGRGISAADKQKIFQLFFTTRPGGTGIGLANTFRFVQLHNGRIEFESEPGRGTTFRIELPLAHLIETPPIKVRDFSQPFAGEKR